MTEYDHEMCRVAKYIIGDILRDNFDCDTVSEAAQYVACTDPAWLQAVANGNNEFYYDVEIIAIELLIEELKEIRDERIMRLPRE